MATVRDTIRRALRMLRVLGAGKEPAAGDAADALSALQSLVTSLPGVGLGGPWIDVEVTSETYTAGEDERVRVSDPDAVTISLPETITAENGSQRPPKNGARVLVVDLLGVSAAAFVYVAWLGAWQQIDGLTLNSPSPFGPEHEEGFAAMLAVRLAPEYGAAVAPEVRQMADEGQRALYARCRPDLSVGIDLGRRCVRRI